MNPFFNKYCGVESKNRGPFLAFSQEWFFRWQPWLLFLLNVPVFRLWFRWILRIHKDCRYSDPIIEIQPDNYKVQLKDGRIRGDFRTHPKFSKRIYFAFRWWWWTLHYLDEAFKPAWMPSFSFGFDTLTTYPDPDPETSSVDGRLFKSTNQTFAAKRAATSASVIDATATMYAVSIENTSTSNPEGVYTGMTRGVFVFYTNLSSGSVISSAVLSLYATAKSVQLGDTTVDIVSITTSSNKNLTTTDYNISNFGSTVYADASISGITLSAYKDFTLNSNGYNNISMPGASKFGTLLGFDTDNITPGWASAKITVLTVRFAEYTGTGSDPRLVITYTPPETLIKSISGLIKSSVKTSSTVAIASLKKIIGLA